MMFAVLGTTISAAIVGGGLYALGVVSSTQFNLPVLVVSFLLQMGVAYPLDIYQR